MTDSTITAAAIGLAAGLAFIAIFGVIYFEAPLIDNIQVPLDRGKNQQIVDIILQDSRVTELLKDRDVTLFYISPPSRFDRCGFGPPANVIMQTDRGYLFVLVDYFHNKVVGAAMQVKGEHIPIFSETINSTENNAKENIQQIASAIITIGPRESHFIQFTVPDCAIEVKVNGTFTASGDGDNDIIVMLMPPDEYYKWRDGASQYGVYGGTGKISAETIELGLGGDGEYSVYLVFDNTFSNSTKTVNADVKLSYKR